jgi:hypothetical protein
MTADQDIQPVGPEKQYFNFIDQGIFKIQRCDGCDSVVFYPREFCPGCGGQKLSWFEPEGHGTVYATTVVHDKDPSKARNIAIIDLDEGARLMSIVTNLAPKAVQIGMRVKAKIIVDDGMSKVVFEHV